jgi:hypothetical protein
MELSMCLPAEKVAARCDRAQALLHALRLVTIARGEEAADDAYSASLFLIREIEEGLHNFEAELKASCPPTT